MIRFSYKPHLLQKPPLLGLSQTPFGFLFFNVFYLKLLCDLKFIFRASFKILFLMLTSIFIQANNLARAQASNTQASTATQSLTTHQELDVPRIVSYSPALTEILFALNLGKFVVGTTTFSDYPEEAKKISLVGSYFKPNIERTVALKPTHVLVMREGDASILEHLKKSNLNFYIFESRSLKNYPQTLERLGQIFHVQKKSIELTNEFHQQLKSLKKNSNKAAILVDEGSFVFAGSDTFLSEALKECGLKNVFNFSGYQKISIEALLESSPNYLFVLKNHGDLQKNSSEQSSEGRDVSLNKIIKNPFLKNVAVRLLDPNILSRLGPRLMTEISKVCSTTPKNSHKKLTEGF